MPKFSGGISYLLIFFVMLHHLLCNMLEQVDAHPKTGKENSSPVKFDCPQNSFTSICCALLPFPARTTLLRPFGCLHIKQYRDVFFLYLMIQFLIT
jgi:hypothetical protein